jgi:hypothetical protein
MNLTPQEYQANFKLASILIATKRIIEKRAGVGTLKATYTAKEIEQAMGRLQIGGGVVSKAILESSTLGIGYSLHKLKATPYSMLYGMSREGKTHTIAKYLEDQKAALIIWDETRIKL